MRVGFLMLAEIDVDDLAEGKDPAAEAQLRLDAFRESVLPNDYGISLYRVGPSDMPSVDQFGVVTEPLTA